MKVIPPVLVTDAMLTASNVPEADHPEWAVGTTYPMGYRVIIAAAHRIYESVADDNVGNDPQEDAGSWWIEVGATNRWAMFDEAVGSVTRRNANIVVTVTPGVAIDTIAVLDTDAVSVRVQMSVGGSGVYDETLVRDVDQVNLVFRDLPDDPAGVITLTASSSGPSAPVEIGTMIIGVAADLGITETGPSISITDFSRRDTDDFGTTTVVERGWAKRMGIRSKIDADDADVVQRRLAAVRARACLWIGEEDYDSLTIYGFFKDFSIDLSLVGVSYCTLTIEGLTNVPPLASSGLQDAIDALEDAVIDPEAGFVGKAMLLVKPNGRVGGIMTTNDKIQRTLDLEFDSFQMFKPDGTLIFRAGDAGDGEDPDDIYMSGIVVDRIRAGSGNSAQFAGAAASTPVSGSGMGTSIVVLSKTIELLRAGTIQATAALAISYSGAVTASQIDLFIGGMNVFSVGGGTTEISVVLAGFNALAAGTHDVQIVFQGPSNMTVEGRNLSTIIIYD